MENLKYLNYLKDILLLVFAIILFYQFFSGTLILPNYIIFELAMLYGATLDNFWWLVALFFAFALIVFAIGLVLPKIKKDSAEKILKKYIAYDISLFAFAILILNAHLITEFLIKILSIPRESFYPLIMPIELLLPILISTYLFYKLFAYIFVKFNKIDTKYDKEGYLVYYQLGFLFYSFVLCIITFLLAK